MSMCISTAQARAKWASRFARFRSFTNTPCSFFELKPNENCEGFKIQTSTPKKIQKGIMFMSLPHIHSQMSTRWQVWVKISGGFNVILRGRRGLWWIYRTCWKGRKSRFVKLSSWPLRLTSACCTNMHGQTRGRYQNSCFLQAAAAGPFMMILWDSLGGAGMKILAKVFASLEEVL